MGPWNSLTVNYMSRESTPLTQAGTASLKDSMDADYLRLEHHHSQAETTSLRAISQVLNKVRATPVHSPRQEPLPQSQQGCRLPGTGASSIISRNNFSLSDVPCINKVRATCFNIMIKPHKMNADEADYSGMSVAQLRCVLKSRGIPSSGYRKKELIALARQAVQLYDEMEPDDQQLQAVKRRRVSVNGQDEVLPDPSKLKGWTTDLSTLPAFQSGHAIAYAGTWLGLLVLII